MKLSIVPALEVKITYANPDRHEDREAVVNALTAVAAHQGLKLDVVSCVGAVLTLRVSGVRRERYPEEEIARLAFIILKMEKAFGRVRREARARKNAQPAK